MYSLFRTTGRNQAMLASPRHGYISERFDEALTRAAYNYRRTPYFVEADHILIQILQQIGLSYEKNDKIFYAEVDNRTSRIARAVGFTDINAKVGASAKNSFFDSSISELVVSVSNGYTDFVSIDGIWKEFAPVKILYHPFNDLTLNIRDGSKTSGVKGYAVIAVDIPLLALQYYKWRKWCERNLEIMPPIGQFVFQYPLVNMMKSDLNMSYFNQLTSYATGLPIIPQKKNYNFSMPDVNMAVKEDIEYILENNQKKDRNLLDLSQAVLLMDNRSVWDVMQLPNISISSMNAGALVLASFPWVATLAQLSFQAGSKDNGATRNFLQKRYRELKNGGAFRGINGVDESVVVNLFEKGILPYLL